MIREQSIFWPNFIVPFYIAEKSLDLHVRKKRLIDRTPNANKPVPIEQVPYIVSITKNGEHACGASILLSNILVTAAHCLESNARNTYFRILSGSARISQGKRHNITKVLFHPLRTSKGYTHDLALLTISPPIDLVYSRNRKISLYNGRVPPNSFGTISGWGRVKINW